jgi:hypothetical protein
MSLPGGGRWEENSMPLVPNRPLRRRRSRPRLGFVAVKWSKDKGSNKSSGSFAGTARKQAGRRTTTIGSAQRRADVTPHLPPKTNSFNGLRGRRAPSRARNASGISNESPA